MTGFWFGVKGFRGWLYVGFCKLALCGFLWVSDVGRVNWAFGFPIWMADGLSDSGSRCFCRTTQQKQSISRCFNLSALSRHPSIRLSTYLLVSYPSLSILSIYLFILAVYLSVLSVPPCLSIHPNLSKSICLPACLSFFPYMSLALSLFLSLALHIYIHTYIFVCACY